MYIEAFKVDYVSGVLSLRGCSRSRKYTCSPLESIHPHAQHSRVAAIGRRDLVLYLRTSYHA
jgi:hypothetical protein